MLLLLPLLLLLLLTATNANTAATTINTNHIRSSNSSNNTTSIITTNYYYAAATTATSAAATAATATGGPESGVRFCGQPAREERHHAPPGRGRAVRHAGSQRIPGRKFEGWVRVGAGGPFFFVVAPFFFVFIVLRQRCTLFLVM